MFAFDGAQRRSSRIPSSATTEKRRLRDRVAGRSERKLAATAPSKLGEWLRGTALTGPERLVDAALRVARQLREEEREHQENDANGNDDDDGHLGVSPLSYSTP